MKAKYKILLASILLLVGINNLFAQEEKIISLEEAIQLGIKNSKSLIVDQAKIDEALASYKKAKNNRLPDLKLSGSAMAMSKGKMNLEMMPNTGNSPKPNSAFMGSANFSFPIYAGGRIKNGIKTTEYLLEASKLSSENDKTAIAYNIAQVYNNLFKINQIINILSENLKAAEERDKAFLNLDNNGVLPRNDRLKANLQTSNIELQLLEAQNNFDITNVSMNLLLGLPVETKLLVDSVYIQNIADDIPLSFYIEQAFKNRKDLQAIALQKKAAELQTKAAKAHLLPTIALTAGYIAADVPQILSMYNMANIGIGVQYDLGNVWKKNTDMMTANAQIKKIDAMNDMTQDQIQLEVVRDYQAYNLANDKIKVFEKTLAQANENYRITKNKFDNGLETITNLLDADAAQITANINVLNAKADKSLLYRKLLQTTGILITE